MNEQVDAVLARLRQYPEHQDAVEVIETLRAENERLREAIETHRRTAEGVVGAPTDDPEYYEPFDHALWAALRESPVPEEPTACEYLPGTIGAEHHCDHWQSDLDGGQCCWCGTDEDDAGSCPGPTGEEREDAEA